MRSLPEMVTIPAGEFYMGTSSEQIARLVETDKWAFEWQEDNRFQVEQPYHKVYTDSYQMGKAPVSNQEYYVFLMQTGHRLPSIWQNLRFATEMGKHPVAGVAYADCLAYCRWLNEETGMSYRLPTEIEWEKASRGTDGRIYPWGDTFEKWRCNTLESNRSETTPIGIFSPSGDSVWGITDIAGNVFEWTSSLYSDYPITSHQQPDPNNNNQQVIIRGGAWYYTSKLARCAARERVIPTYVSPVLGFRLAMSVGS